MLYLESPIGQLEDLLRRVCLELQVSAPKHEVLEGHYEAVGRWLAQKGSPLADAGPVIYGQGSGAIGTLNKPLGRDKYDLDAVCEFTALDWSRLNALDVLNAVEARLRQHDTYKPMIERKNRCIRLVYADGFHLDILPACPVSLHVGEGPLKVPDREIKTWKDSYPKGYAKWFKTRSEYRGPVRLTEAIRNDVEPLPDHLPMHEKEPLQLAVQLLKRHRDVAFQRKDNAPISIVLTTLAGQYYNGATNLYDVVDGILDGITRAIIANPMQRLVVLNPVNNKEYLSEKWNEAGTGYKNFVEWVSTLSTAWKKLPRVQGLQNVVQTVGEMFGEEISKTALKNQTHHLSEMRKSNRIGVSTVAGGLTMATALKSVPARGNTFFGS